MLSQLESNEGDDDDGVFLFFTWPADGTSESILYTMLQTTIFIIYTGDVIKCTGSYVPVAYTYKYN